MLPINKEFELGFKTCNKCIHGLVQVVQDKPSTNRYQRLEEKTKESNNKEEAASEFRS